MYIHIYLYIYTYTYADRNLEDGRGRREGERRVTPGEIRVRPPLRKPSNLTPSALFGFNT